MVRKGIRNLITDVAGLRVGHAVDTAARTGTTVLVADNPAVAVVDVRGGAPGTRETDMLDPVNLVGEIDAIVLSGGSVFGLDSASGVVAGLSARGRGFRMSPNAPPAPIVPAAILFDLANGGNKQWGDMPPYRVLGRKALAAASLDFELGNQGAGLGARAGSYKGGLGSASAVTDDGYTVGALVAVNSVGSPVIPGSDVFWSFLFEQEREFGGRVLQAMPSRDLDLPSDMRAAVAGQATTIGIIAVDTDLTRVELKRLVVMAADGFARAIRPVHSPFDGDLIFAVSTRARELAEPRQRNVMRLGSIAADTVARAIARGVYEAETLGEMKSYRDTFAREEKTHG